MKQLILIFILILTMVDIQSQTCIGFVPETRNLALMQHFTVSNKLGIYAKARTGDIQYPGFSCNEFVFSTGISYKCMYATVLIGSSYNHYSNIENDAPNINLNKIYRYTFDIGVLSAIGHSDNLYVWNYNDLLNWYSEIGIGFKFNLKNNNDERNL